MATSQPSLATGRGLVAVRVTILDTDGSRVCSNTDGTAYSLCPVSIATSEDVDAGETQTKRCGDGSVFATYSTDDAITGLEITLTLSPYDLEFIEVATGATPLLDAGDIIGLSGGNDFYALPTEFHCWQEAYSGSALAASPYSYWHHVFPHVRWRRQVPPLAEGFNDVVLIGKVQGNLNLGNGSFLDIPVEAFEDSAELHAWWRADDLPDADTSPYNNGLGGGYIDTPACAS